jgi:hypothetical protein
MQPPKRQYLFSHQGTQKGVNGVKEWSSTTYKAFLKANFHCTIQVFVIVGIIPMEHNTRIISPFFRLLIDRIPTTRELRIEFLLNLQIYIME